MGELANIIADGIEDLSNQFLSGQNAQLKLKIQRLEEDVERLRGLRKSDKEATESLENGSELARLREIESRIVTIHGSAVIGPCEDHSDELVQSRIKRLVREVSMDAQGFVERHFDYDGSVFGIGDECSIYASLSVLRPKNVEG